MQLRYSVVLLFILLLLPSWGCVAKPAQRDVWFDMAGANANIVKQKEKSALLTAEGNESGATPQTRKEKDLSKTKGAGNEFLDSLRKPEERDFGEVEDIDEEGILLNFDNADLYEVIQVIADVLDLDYLIDPNIKGVVNIRSREKIAKNELFAVFQKILNINGLDIRKEGEFDVIYLAKKLSSQVIYDPDQIGQLTDSPRLIIQVVPVMHLSSTEAEKLIEPYLSSQGTTYNLASQNMLLIIDFEGKILDALTVLSRIDISALASLKVRLIRIDNAPLFDLRDELLEVLNALKVNKKDFEGVSIVPLERVNSLLLVSNNEFLLKTATEWISELDTSREEASGNVYIYNVRNSLASELAELVGNLLEEKDGASRVSKVSKPAQVSKGAEATNKAMSAKATPAKAATATEQGPTLTADDSRNIILVRGLPAEFARIQKLLERLDNLPRQVLIEVMVAEVTLDDSWEFGVEWAMKNHRLGNGGPYDEFLKSSNLGTVTEGMSGLTYALKSSANDIVALLGTLASDNRISILSSPQIMVLNNETASVNVGSQVPIVTSDTIIDTQTTTTTANSVRTVQYKDTGIILTVTPRINYNGIILLDVDQQVSEASDKTTGGFNSPVISTRQLKTKLAVKDGQSILMGGLIEKKNTNSESGVPYFKDLPYMGWLFKYRKESTKKTELLVMITPYVIESEDVLDQYISGFKEKMTRLRQDLNAKEKTKESEKSDAPVSH